MARYFHISNGLRGCYMPDSVSCIKVDTRRELKAALESEAEHLRDAGYVGLSKANVASLAACAWLDARTTRFGSETIAACAPHRGALCTYPVACSPATRADWLEYEGSDS